VCGARSGPLSSTTPRGCRPRSKTRPFKRQTDLPIRKERLLRGLLSPLSTTGTAAEMEDSLAQP
jgi:hypothetical protein